MAKDLKKKAPTKDCYLGLKIHESYKEKLEKRQAKNGDESISQTARKILYSSLDQTK